MNHCWAVCRVHVEEAVEYASELKDKVVTERKGGRAGAHLCRLLFCVGTCFTALACTSPTAAPCIKKPKAKLACCECGGEDVAEER